MNDMFQQHSSNEYSKTVTRDFFKNVYAYMFGALAISGMVAYMAGTPEFFFKYFVNETGGMKPLFHIAMWSPLVLGIVIQTAYHRLSLGVLLLLFLAYSALMGLSLSTILLAYAGAKVAMTFFVTAGAFGAMAVLGYTTKIDLTKFGSLLYMAFIGMFIAGIANYFFFNSIGLQFWISVIGVFVFTGLTAYYMQQLKTAAQQQMFSTIERNKLALVGGLVLYILFINLFTSLLSIMGRD